MAHTALEDSANRCRRCNRVLKDPNALYGWRCAEILGVWQQLNYSGDGSFAAYIRGIEEAERFLNTYSIKPAGIDLAKFYSSYVKQYLTAGINDYQLWALAYEDLVSALQPTLAGDGRWMEQEDVSPPLEFYLEVWDQGDYQSGNYTTTALSDNTFDQTTYQLQHWLNEQGYTDKFGNPLKENGINGPNTEWAGNMAKGMAPSLSYISPLPKSMKIGMDASGLHSMILDMGKTKIRPKGNAIFRFSGAHQLDGRDIGVHINTLDHIDDIDNGNFNPIQKWTLKKLDHTEVPEWIYNNFRNFDDLAGKAKIGGTALSAVGFILDGYELATTVYSDLNDEDQKLGKETLKTAVGLGAGWAGSAGGAKLGAMGGAALGTLICPGLGTVIGGFIGGLVGGSVGSYAARELGEYVVDQTYKGA